MEKNSSQRIEEFDILKGFGILIVVIFHALFFNFEMYSYNMKNFLYFLGPFGTPVVVIFFFVSGFLGYRSYSKDQNAFYFIIKKLKTFLPPYFIWSTVYIVLQIFFDQYSGGHYEINFFNIFESYAFATAYLPFYFLFVLIIMYIITPYLFNMKSLNFLLMLMFFTGIVFASIYYVPQYFGILLVNSLISYRNPLFWAFFYIWGMQSAKMNKFFWNKRPASWLFILFISSYAGSVVMTLTVPKMIQDYESYIALGPIQYVFYFSSMPIFLWLSYKAKSYKMSHLLSGFGRHSLAIYINHVLIIGLIFAAFMPFMPKITFSANIYIQLLIGIIACFGAYMVSEMVRKMSKKAYEIIF
jgi:fucose 4-O-acetylase-like acetyltransferase